MRHGVAGVHGQVEQRQLQATLIHLYRPKSGLGLRLDAQIAAQRVTEQHCQLAHARGQVGGFGLQALPPAECQQPPCQLRTASGRLLDAVDQLLAALLRLRPAQHVQPADHHGQEIVEVMRDAAGELAQRLQLLLLEQPLLRLLACLDLGFEPRAEFPVLPLQGGVGGEQLTMVRKTLIRLLIYGLRRLPFGTEPVRLAGRPGPFAIRSRHGHASFAIDDGCMVAPRGLAGQRLSGPFARLGSRRGMFQRPRSRNRASMADAADGARTFPPPMK